MKRILLACEESQALTQRFRDKGFEAFSCDIQECSGKYPQWHLKGDVRDYLNEHWDCIIAFPPCTYLTVTGNRWFNVEKYKDAAIQRQKLREEAVEFFMLFALHPCAKIAIENPVGVMSTLYRKPDQIIQPWMFGDAFEKKTCLWLKGLPALKPTNVVDPPKRTEYNSGKSIPTWYANLSKKQRAKIRSKTFDGIADAMVNQWEHLI